LKAYLAAQYARRDELRTYVKPLADVGIEVTSRWLEEDAPLKSQMGDHTEEFYKYTAKIDLEDIDRADIVIFFAEDPLVGVVRGGRHVEFGYALAKEKPIAAISFKENVFHYVEGVFHFDTLEDYLKVARSKSTEAIQEYAEKNGYKY
jgi:nucleoside 2-deoxyribosyltransferase